MDGHASEEDEQRDWKVDCSSGQLVRKEHLDSPKLPEPESSLARRSTDDKENDNGQQKNGRDQDT